MSLTREDMLRELELLPVWRLRAPAQPQAQPVETAAVVNPPQIIAATEFSYSLTISNDKKWAFVWPASHDLSASQAALFNNILQALKIEKTNKTTLASAADIEAKVIVALGETAAQALLNTQESIEQLRGKTHLLHNIPLIVTYHPADCLQDLQNKAKTWDDLCMALNMLRA
jgi:uracil-DNA glycosylase